MSAQKPTGDTVSIDDFKRAFRNHPAGVCVITADDGTGPVGMTATSLSSVSTSPPLVMFSMSALSSSTPTVLNAQTAVIDVVDAGGLHVAKLCATSGVDRFAGDAGWWRLESGEPVFRDAHTRLLIQPVHKIDVTMSTVVIAEVLEIEFSAQCDQGSAAPLVYHSGDWHVLSDRSRV